MERQPAKFARYILPAGQPLAFQGEPDCIGAFHGSWAPDRSCQGRNANVPPRGRQRRSCLSRPALRDRAACQHPESFPRNGDGAVRPFESLHWSKGAWRNVAENRSLAWSRSEDSASLLRQAMKNEGKLRWLI